VIGARRRRHHEDGQAIVEFALLLPVFALLLMGMLEFGLAFNHHLTIEYATREGARVGSALATGGRTNCLAGADIYQIDEQTVAAVQRILKSPGSPVNVAGVTEIRTYRADSAGNQIATQANIWSYTPGAGPNIDPSGTDRLDFTRTSTGWPVCSRSNGSNPDSIGVSISYNYAFTTPLGTLMGFFGATRLTSIADYDRTVMALNPDS
jgi:hypothetical protein